MRGLLKKNRLIVLFLLLCLSSQVFIYNKISAIGSTGTVGEAGKIVQASSIRITNSPKYVLIGKSYNLKAEISPSNTTDKTITWTSSNPSILTVDKNGKAVGKKAGTVKLTATTSNGRVNSIAVTVKKENNTNGITKVKSVSIKGAKTEMLVGDTQKLKVSFLPKGDIDDDIVTYKSSNEKVLKVDSNGLVTAVGKGIAKITVTSRSNSKASKTITIKVSSAKITLSKTSVSVSKGDTVDLTATVESNKDYSANEVKWQSTSTSNVTVKQNSKTKNQYKATVSAKKQGTATVKVSVDGEVATAKVQVIETDQDYSLDCPTMSYDTTDNSQIKITIKPANTTTKWEYYTSTNRTTGSNASWKKIKSYTGSDQTTVTSKYTEAQGKIIVYGKEGTSRVCYTAPFDYDKSKKSNTTLTKNTDIVCPTLTYKTEKMSKNAAEYTVDFDSVKVSTGVKKSYISINPTKNKNYQYTWYSNREKSIYQIYKTFNTKTPASLTINQNYNRQGIVLTMDSNGDVLECKTKIYGNVLFKKKKDVDGTIIYFENNYKYDSNEIINFIEKLPKNYLAAPEIFFLTENTYHKIVGKTNDACSKASNDSMQIYIRDGSGCDEDWTKFSLVHALSHSMDYMYEKINDDQLSESTDNLNKYTSYKNQKNNGIYKYLSSYSYKNQQEFFADLISILYINSSDNKYIKTNNYRDIYKTDTELNKLNQANLDIISNLYTQKNNEWNELKKAFN